MHTKQYIGYIRGERVCDSVRGCGRSWFPQCASEPTCPASACNQSFRTFARVSTSDLEEWQAVVPAQPANKDHQTYITNTFQFHDIRLATVSVFEETTAEDDKGFVRCSLYWAVNDTMLNETGSMFPNKIHGDRGEWYAIGDRPGGDDLIPLGSMSEGDFDAGLCYASQPVSSRDGERLYYWGANGEHYAPHNASLGLAALRPERFAGVSAVSGAVDGGDDEPRLRTVDLQCTGPVLVVTGDTQCHGGSISVGVIGSQTLSLEQSIPVVGTNVTQHAVGFPEATDPQRPLASLVGKRVRLEFRLKGCAVLVSFGFA